MTRLDELRDTDRAWWSVTDKRTSGWTTVNDESVTYVSKGRVYTPTVVLARVVSCGDDQRRDIQRD